MATFHVLNISSPSRDSSWYAPRLVSFFSSDVKPSQDKISWLKLFVSYTTVVLGIRSLLDDGA